MLSIVVTTCRQRHQVEACLDSVLAQEADEPYEVIVVDDASPDGTADLVRGRYGDRVRLIAKPVPAGWLDSLRRGAEAAAGDPLVIFDPHCRAHAGWLATIAAAFTGDVGVVSCRCVHGKRFVEKLAALTIHGEVLSARPHAMGFFFDDSSAFRKDVLLRLLDQVPSRPDFGDAIGSVLLAAVMRRAGVMAHHLPACPTWHFTPTFRAYLGIWWREAAECTMVTRRVDPDLRGGRARKLGPLAPFILAPARYLQDVLSILARRRDAGARWLEVPALCAAAWVGKAVYFLGLFRFLGRR